MCSITERKAFKRKKSQYQNFLAWGTGKMNLHSIVVQRLQEKGFGGKTKRLFGDTLNLRCLLDVDFWYHAKSCPTLCNPMDFSPPGSSVHGILQGRIVEWVAISYSNQVLMAVGYKYLRAQGEVRTRLQKWELAYNSTDFQWSDSQEL